MPLIAMVSAKGSPGVSTAALACTLTWPAPTLLVEADPAGGDLLAGYLARYELPSDRGILPLASAAVRGAAEYEFAGQLIDLDSPRQQRMVLPGIATPDQSASLAPAWARLGEFFASMAPTVIADCGRLHAPHAPIPLLALADLVLVVVRPYSIRSVSPVIPALNKLRREIPDDQANIGLLLVGDGISPKELTKNLGVPVLGRLAWDPSTAAGLCGEGKGRKRGALMRSATATYRTVYQTLSGKRTVNSALARRDTDVVPVVR